MKKLIKYRKITDYNLIEKFLSHNFSSPTHWPEWNILVSKYYKTIFYYYGLFENENLIGIFPVHEMKIGFIINMNSGQYHYMPYGGWLFSKQIIFNVRKFKISQLSNLQAFCLPAIQEFNANYKRNYIKKFFSTLIVDLDTDYNNIFKDSFNHRVRKNIRKAEKNGIKLSINNDVNLFYEYYIEACNKNRLNSLSKDFFFDLIGSLRNIKLKILFAKKEKDILGYLVIIFDKNYAFSWLTHNIINAPKLGQGEFLHSEAIKIASENGCKYFDLCYVEKVKLPQIYQFKKGFSGKEIEVPYFAIKPMLFRVINKIQKSK